MRWQSILCNKCTYTFCRFSVIAAEVPCEPTQRDNEKSVLGGSKYLKSPSYYSSLNPLHVSYFIAALLTLPETMPRYTFYYALTIFLYSGIHIASFTACSMFSGVFLATPSLIAAFATSIATLIETSCNLSMLEVDQHLVYHDQPFQQSHPLKQRTCLL